MKPAVFGLLVVVTAAAGGPASQSQQTFTGVITDEMCPLATHSHMRMGPTDAECARACIMSHDGKYVLYDGKSAYLLSDQNTPDKFAAQKVRVVGTLDEKTRTIRVESIAAAR